MAQGEAQAEPAQPQIQRRASPRLAGEDASAGGGGSGHKRECSGGAAATSAGGEMKRSRSISSSLQDLKVNQANSGEASPK